MDSRITFLLLAWGAAAWIACAPALVPPVSVSGEPPCLSVDVNAATIPADVCAEADENNDVRFFDAYSWRAFLAAVRPAGQNRGEPDLMQPVGTTDRPLVFETFKANWEVFADRDTPDAPPPPANWPVRPAATPCGDGSTIETTDLVISSFGELEELAQAGEGPADVRAPIVSQNREYVRYTMGYNRVLFDAIKEQHLYLYSNLNNVRVPPGSVAVKAAWMMVNDALPQPERYYRRHAQVRTIDGNRCERRQVALIGLHIIQKTPKRRQWVWATFEHADNAPPPYGPRPFALHNGNELQQMPRRNPLDISMLPPDPDPFNIERQLPIHPQTLEANRAYAQVLTGLGAVWRNYQLVMTQWPRSANQPREDGTPRNTIPGTADTRYTSYANTAIETYFQEPITSGCMNCHDTVRRGTGEFLWSLPMHAWRPPDDTNLSGNYRRLLRNLADLLTTNR